VSRENRTGLAHSLAKAMCSWIGWCLGNGDLAEYEEQKDGWSNGRHV
jgi:hypothetical protein